MPKRKKLLTPLKKKSNNLKVVNNEYKDKEVSTPRGRLKGALLDALEPADEESDVSLEQRTIKHERNASQDRKKEKLGSEEDDLLQRRRSPHRQPYVLKLFDRSVDLSQFEEDSPLYPICRAWIVNQPKANYHKFGRKHEEPEPTEDSVELPGPQGPVVSRIPKLLPEQELANKDNINLNYRENPPPSKDDLLQSHVARWVGVRRAWLQQNAKVEARYEATQQLLNRININANN